MTAIPIDIDIIEIDDETHFHTLSEKTTRRCARCESTLPTTHFMGPRPVLRDVTNSNPPKVFKFCNPYRAKVTDSNKARSALSMQKRRDVKDVAFAERTLHCTFEEAFDTLEERFTLLSSSLMLDGIVPAHFLL